MIVNVNMPAQHGSIGNHHEAADLAIVGNMRAGHEEVVTADLSNAVFFFSSAVNGHAFTNQVVIADDDLRVAPSVAEILRITTDHYTWKEMVALANGHMPHQRHVVFQLRPASDSYVRADH